MRRTLAALGLWCLAACSGPSVDPSDASMRMDATLDGGGALDAFREVDATGGDDGATDAAADAASHSLPSCAEGVHAWLAIGRIAPLPRDDDRYRAPNAAARAALGDAITAIAMGALADAETSAASAGYVLCRGEGDERDLLLLRPEAPASGHATLAIDLAPARALILEAPHPLWDRDTGEESVAIFDRTGARAVMISGTHRCGSDRESGCDGTADACGDGAPVRESDMAHAVDSMFHAAHLALAAAYADALVVSVHGFTGPGISISDGTTDPTVASAPSARLASALHARFPAATITTCNDFGDADVPRDVRVCGTTNVQGRALNGAASECTDAADVASGRFVHMEQAPDFRPEEASAIADALIEALDAE